jgi:hypothetical protein
MYIGTILTITENDVVWYPDVTYHNPDPKCLTNTISSELDIVFFSFGPYLKYFQVHTTYEHITACCEDY